MDMLLGLVSLAGLSLFLAERFKRSASGMPLVAVAAAMLWFTLFGVLGALRLGGWLWYLGCFAALGWVVRRQRGAIVRLFTPGFVLFLALGAAFIGLFFATQPLLTQWDEFTVWGTAAKVVSTTGQLYTVAPSNLLARYQPPGLAMFSYMMQFFGSFAEYKYIAALALVYLAAFAAATTLWDKTRAGAVVAMGGLVLLPLLFEGGGAGVSSFAYLTGMADTALAALFGGALCLYFSTPQKDARLAALTGLVLAALTNLKDMGFAFACLAWLVITADLLFCRFKTLSFGGLKKAPGLAASAGLSLACVAAAYGGWALYLGRALKVDRGNVGSGGETMGQLEMLTKGVLAFLRIQPNEVFDDRFAKMAAAFLGTHPEWGLNGRVWLLGTGVRLLALIAGILLCAWLLSPAGRRRPVAVFALSTGAGFAAYWLFITITYTYVFQEIEGVVLTAYGRYLFPFWFAWLMASMVLLAGAALPAAPAGQAAAPEKKQKRWALAGQWRQMAAQGLSALLCLALLAAVALRGNWSSNFMGQSPSLYAQRRDVQAVLATARQQGMQPEDVVYIISQGDDAGRFYMFSYEMPQALLPMYGGRANPGGQTANSLVEPGNQNPAYRFWVECTPEELLAYLASKGCTHLLLDVTDGYIVQTFGYLFSDGLAGWGEDGGYSGGWRYYEINRQGAEPRFVRAEGGAA